MFYATIDTAALPYLLSNYFYRVNTNCKLSYLAKHDVTDEMRLQDKLIFTLLQKKKEMEAYGWWGSKLLLKLSIKISLTPAYPPIKD